MENKFQETAPFLYDRMQIINSKAFRRLEGKTQVVSGNKNCHIRTRLTHSLEVEMIAITIAKILGRNQALVSAGSVGHDTAHVIFGHFGERFFTDKLGEDFRHEKFAAFVLEVVEGLVLQLETMRSIIYHSRGNGDIKLVNNDEWMEYDILMLSDKMGYVVSDVEDLKLEKEDAISSALNSFGSDRNSRLWTLISALCQESRENGSISFSKSQTAQDFKAIRAWTFKEVYPKIDLWRDENLTQILDDIMLFFRGRYTMRESVLLIALMGEDELERLYKNIHAKARAKVWEELENHKEFSYSEISGKVGDWAKMDFLNYYKKFV